LSALSLLAARLAGLRAADPGEVRVERDLAVPVDDGVVLVADRWVPAGAGVAPLVVMRSPYGRRSLDLVGRLLAERGYQVLVQSVRGTFGSGGTWEPFRHERADGSATARWLAQQPWWPGAVGTFGPSYLGLTQWALASADPAVTAAVALSVTSSSFRDSVVFPGGSFALETGATWLYLLEHQQSGWVRALWSQLGARSALRSAYRTLPLERAESALLGHRVGYYQDWLRHERPGDRWWQEVDFSGACRSMPPVSMVAGWFDIFLPYQLDDYAALRAAGRPVSLTIGPWVHSSLRMSGVALADAIELFDARLRPAPQGPGTAAANRPCAPAGSVAPIGSDRDRRREGRVRLALVGRRGWVEVDGWPPPGQRVHWYLHGDGGLRRSGPTPAGPSRYRWDPADPTPGVGGASLDPANAGRRDQRRREERPDVRTWTSDVLPDRFALVGPVEAQVWFRASNRFSDLFVRLCTVSPSGRSRNLSDGILRMEAGPGGGAVSLGAPVDGDVFDAGDGIVRVRIRMWPVGVELGAGCRLRVQVSGGAHPLFARNLGGGERLGTGARLVPSDHEIFHDPDHPSAIVLPHAHIA
jgi:putative CocE/NonD family hydrolase